jgi:hypothetical protein
MSLKHEQHRSLPIAIEVEWIESWIVAEFDKPATHPDGTVIGKYIYSLPDEQPE